MKLICSKVFLLFLLIALLFYPLSAALTQEYQSHDEWDDDSYDDAKIECGKHAGEELTYKLRVRGVGTTDEFVPYNWPEKEPPDPCYCETFSFGGVDYIEACREGNNVRFVFLVDNKIYDVFAYHPWGDGTHYYRWDTFYRHAVDLEIEGVPEEEEENPGGFVAVNDDDDNGNDTPDKEENPVSGEDDLVKVYLHRPEELFGYLTLSAPQGGSKIKVWESKTKEVNDLITLPKSWELEGDGAPHVVWVEGINASDDPRDVRLLLEFGDWTSDEVRFTVVGVEIDTPSFPAYVPVNEELQLGSTGMPGGGTYSWSKVSGPGNVTFSPSATTEDPTFKADAAGTYTVKVEYTKDGFTVSDTSGNIYVLELTLSYDEDPDTYLPIKNDIIEVTADVGAAKDGIDVRFELTQQHYFKFSDDTTAPKTVPTDATGKASVHIKSTTYYGVATVKATIVDFPTCWDEDQIPTDEDDDKIADSWEQGPTGGGMELNASWDYEHVEGITEDGDGFLRIFEYAGYTVGGAHHRMDATKKEVFANTTSTATEKAFAISGLESLDLKVIQVSSDPEFEAGSGKTAMVFTKGTYDNELNDGDIWDEDGNSKGDTSIARGVATGVFKGQGVATIYETAISNIWNKNKVKESATVELSWPLPVIGGTQEWTARYTNTDLNGDGDTTDLINAFDLMSAGDDNDAIDGKYAGHTLTLGRQRTTRHEAGHLVGIGEGDINEASVMRTCYGPARAETYTAHDKEQVDLK